MTVLSHQDCSILFVVKGSANVVHAWIIAVTTVTVFHHYIAMVKLILQNVMVIAAPIAAPTTTMAVVRHK